MTEKTRAAQRRCLLLAPLSFYTFHRTVAVGLERRGYIVDTLNEEFPANTFGKVLGKLALPVLRKLTLRGLQVRLAGLPHYDLVVIIKGRGLGPQALAYLRTKADRVVGYNFDSFLFNASPLDWYQMADRYATFDIDDAKTYGIPLVHLFSAADLPPATTRLYDISIIQRVHSDRLAFADLLLKSLPFGARPFVYLYESSALTFALGLLRHPRLYMRLWAHISLKPLAYTRAMELLGQSRVTFDYAHPKQTGVTVRCFEAQSLGVTILTNNRAAVECGLFEPDLIAHLPKNATNATVMGLVLNLMNQTAQPRSRSLNDFLDDLLNNIPFRTSPTTRNLGEIA